MEVEDVSSEGDAVATGHAASQSKNPLEKMRVRLAAENYKNPNNNYKTMPDDSDDEHSAGMIFHCYTRSQWSACCARGPRFESRCGQKFVF